MLLVRWMRWKMVLSAVIGSNWNNGTNAEPFYWNLNNSVGNRNRNISGQLEYAIKLVDYQP